MRDGDKRRYSLINRRDQPVELLLPGGALTLMPHGWVEVDAEVAGAPQIQELCRRRLLALNPVDASPPALEEQAGTGAGAAPAPGQRRRNKRRGRTDATPERE